jgi:hypothetical protein
VQPSHAAAQLLVSLGFATDASAYLLGLLSRVALSGWWLHLTHCFCISCLREFVVRAQECK